MPIEKVERFHCRKCGYITETPHIVHDIKMGGKCPACQDGKSIMWVKNGDQFVTRGSMEVDDAND